jgi:tol-pal system protein YbgF
MRGRLLPLLAALLLSGCVATQRDILDLENQTDELKHQIIDLNKTISSMQANQADLSVQMKQLLENLGGFTETIEQSRGDMNMLSTKLDDLGAAVTNKVAAIGSSLTAAQAKGIEEQKASLASQAAQGSASDLFQAAEVRLAKKSFDLAAKGFAQYIEKYPKGALIDLATYNLGESYFGQKNWEAAGRQFAIVLEKHPKSAMTASARLMYAVSLMKMKRNLPEARQYLESVTADFPSSPEAKAAATHLKKLAAQ